MGETKIFILVICQKSDKNGKIMEIPHNKYGSLQSPGGRPIPLGTNDLLHPSPLLRVPEGSLSAWGTEKRRSLQTMPIPKADICSFKFTDTIASLYGSRN